MKPIKTGITAARGFLAAGIHCGIKYKNKDLALIYSSVPALACAVFTQNRVQAEPLKVTAAHLQDNMAQAIIVNSGNANCCTGRQGMQAARAMCASVAKRLSIDVDDVLVASTGIIGQRLPLEKIERKIDDLVKSLSRRGSWPAAQAIMTTDTRPKQISVQLKVGRSLVHIGGIAKGAGMIAPNLATMLAFITTDVVIDKLKLRQALHDAVDNSFNLISVEGDTSTNDLVLILANGLAGNSSMTAKEFMAFQQGLSFVCLALAKMIIKDAEGASKFVEINVSGAKSVAQGKNIAFQVANSPLIKTAIFGENPNWGRIAARVGSADRDVRQGSLDIYLGPVKVMAKGEAVKAGQRKSKDAFKKDEVRIKIALGLGRFSARVFTCDLSNEYVKINAEY